MEKTDLKTIKRAFRQDGFLVIKKVVQVNGRYGIRAETPLARSHETKQAKMALYLEGTPYEMGFQTGLLAEPEIARMSTEFVETVAANYFVSWLPDEIEILLGKWINDRVYPAVEKLAGSSAIPAEFNEQIKGVLDGCKEVCQQAGTETKVTLKGLRLLNYGQNVICSFIYHGKFLEGVGILPSFLRLPTMCNAFSLSGDIVKGDCHYFGRDLMFITGGVLQDTICLMIYNPDSSYRGTAALPTTVQSVPGMVGSMVSMNQKGVAMGVDIAASTACDPDDPGICPLFLVRHAVQYAEDADALVKQVREAKRGVSWVYPFADASSGRSGVIETIRSLDPAQFPTKARLAEYFLDFALEKPKSLPLKLFLGSFISGLKKRLPSLDFIERHMQQFEDLRTGIFTRWNDYRYPDEYLEFNKGLWEYFNSQFWFLGRKKLLDDAFSPDGFISPLEMHRQAFEKNCPATYYFAPQRERLAYDVLTTNHFVAPEFRLVTMNYWTAALMSLMGEVDDIQWRYDQLNFLIIQALKKGRVDKKTAKNLIDFLNPLAGRFPFYYKNHKKILPTERDSVCVNGSTSLLELKKKVLHSHFGYYNDRWVKLTMPRYFA